MRWTCVRFYIFPIIIRSLAALYALAGFSCSIFFHWNLLQCVFYICSALPSVFFCCFCCSFFKLITTKRREQSNKKINININTGPGDDQWHDFILICMQLFWCDQIFHNFLISSIHSFQNEYHQRTIFRAHKHTKKSTSFWLSRFIICCFSSSPSSLVDQSSGDYFVFLKCVKFSGCHWDRCSIDYAKPMRQYESVACCFKHNWCNLHPKKKKAALRRWWKTITKQK